MATTAQAAWVGLDSRQRAYLEVLFQVDQDLEEHHRRMGATGRYSSVPARIWRRMPVGVQRDAVVLLGRATAPWIRAGSVPILRGRVEQLAHGQLFLAFTHACTAGGPGRRRV
ncbi:hypothetical protein [Nocardia sp. NPDC004860]|uniref:hypothetical protein n=1 Tax=Nocardia sp. NPDC004860 TaxID=3154557 RepID=UPI0033A1C7C8